MQPTLRVVVSSQCFLTAELTNTRSKSLHSPTMSYVIFPPVLPHSYLTIRSPDARPPYRRIHFPILPSQQGRRKLFLLSAEDEPSRLEAVVSDLARFEWLGC